MPWIMLRPADFHTWHDAECAARGIPKPGRRQSDQAVVVDNEWTTAWVKPTYEVTVGGNPYYVVWLPDGDPEPARSAVLDALDVDRDTGAVTITYQGTPRPAALSMVNVAKVKPASIVIDGVTYTRTR